MRYILLPVIAIPLILAGCVHPHPNRKAHIHTHHPDVMILYAKPSPKRHCKRHNHHWDCHR